MSDWTWFNASAPRFTVFGVGVRLWNVFNRRTADGDHWWGVGLLQVGSRHLLFVGHCGFYALFLGRTP